VVVGPFTGRASRDEVAREIIRRLPKCKWAKLAEMMEALKESVANGCIRKAA
jgi:hypothetical protein